MDIRGLSIWLTIAVAAFGSACSTQGETTSDVGSLRMPLRGSAPSGNIYQLTGALFDVTQMDAPVATLDSDADPASTVISADLAEGGYEISLRAGWAMFDVASGTEVSATLLSPVSQGFSIVTDTTTNVAYRFQVNGEVVNVGGSLEVTLDIVEAATCSSDPQAAALAACTAQFGGNCYDTGTSIIGYVNFEGDNCNLDTMQWAQFCYANAADLYNCNTCEVGAIKQAHSPCECGDNTATVGSFCSGASSVTYSQAFVGGEFSTNPGVQCDAWNVFRGSIDAGTVYGSVTLRNTDGSAAVCTGPEANVICQGLRDGITMGTVSCGGRDWAVGDCGGVELSANGNICYCDEGYAIRPCIGNDNWGGAGTPTCGGPSQTLEVICE